MNLSFQDYLKLDRLGGKDFKTTLSLKLLDLSPSNELGDKILKFLAAPGLDKTGHIIQGAEQDNLTRAISQLDREKDGELRARTYKAIASLCMANESSAAVATFSSRASSEAKLDEHFPRFIGLQGVNLVAKGFLESLCSDMLKEALEFRLAIREKSLEPIREEGLKRG